jgi:membrane associated rhomboid family serine protease
VTTGDGQRPPCHHPPDAPTSARCERCGAPICQHCARLARLQQLCPKDARWSDDRISLRRFPLTFTLVGVNAGMLVLAAIRSGHLGGVVEPDPYVLCQLGAVNASAILGPPQQWWRLLTAIFLHASLLHLLLNTVGLLLLAPALEEGLGRRRFLVVYAGAGAAGAAASLAVYHPQLGLGASGAVFGVGGGLVALWHHYRASIGRDVWTIGLGMAAASLVLSALHVGVDNAAHAGGLLAGLGIVALLLHRRSPLLTAAGLVLPAALTAALAAIAVAGFTPSPVPEPPCLLF